MNPPDSDRDPLAIKNATTLKKRFGTRLHVVNGLFSNLDQILKKLNILDIYELFHLKLIY